MRLPLTPSQTVGPYLHIGMDWLNTSDLTAPGVTGERIVITGRVLDADRQPVPDGVVEIWQANAHGKYAHPDDTRALPLEGFTGFGRCATDAEGRFRFVTVRPGSVPGMNGTPQAPHVLVNVFARGLLKQLSTRIYFFGDNHADDFVLQQVPAERRATLVATPAAEQGTYVRDIVLGGGADETVFFDI
jgi:protocatechuate 3,4-dioxygenase alpha subunit